MEIRNLLLIISRTALDEYFNGNTLYMINKYNIQYFFYRASEINIIF